MPKEPKGTKMLCKDHPEHLDHPGSSLDLRRLKASMANWLEDLERGGDLLEDSLATCGQ